jgi:hypothetical protein
MLLARSYPLAPKYLFPKDIIADFEPEKAAFIPRRQEEKKE